MFLVWLMWLKIVGHMTLATHLTSYKLCFKRIDRVETITSSIGNHLLMYLELWGHHELQCLQCFTPPAHTHTHHPLLYHSFLCKVAESWSRCQVTLAKGPTKPWTVCQSITGPLITVSVWSRGSERCRPIARIKNQS